MKQKLILVIVFSIAFAFVEAAVVVYLRQLLNSTQPNINKEEIFSLLPDITFFQPQAAIKIISDTQILNVERIREASTIVVIATMAAMNSKRVGDWLAFFALSFGVWDIFYYVFLRLTIGWPKSFSDPDVFFLLPTPWIGPVFVPIIISSFLICSSLYYLFLKRKNNI